MVLLRERNLIGHIFVPATAMWPSTTDGSAEPAKTEFGTNDVDLQTNDFDQTTQEHAQFTVMMPDDWNKLKLKFKASWTAAAGTGNVVWGLQARSYGDNEAIDAAFGAAQEVTDVLQAVDRVNLTDESAEITLAGAPSLNDLVQFRVFRKAGSDTLTADAKLIGVLIEYGKV